MELAAKRRDAREVSRTFTMRLVRCLWILGAAGTILAYALRGRWAHPSRGAPATD